MIGAGGLALVILLPTVGRQTEGGAPPSPEPPGSPYSEDVSPEVASSEMASSEVSSAEVPSGPTEPPPMAPALFPAMTDTAELAPGERTHLDDFGLRHSPGGSALRSLVVPGWGQWHTGHPRKALLALAVQGGLAVWIAAETRDVDRHLRRSRAALETDTDVAAGDAPHYAEYLVHFERRRDLAVYLGLATVGFAFDAYADAVLAGFDDEFEDFPRTPGRPVPAASSGGVTPVSHGRVSSAGGSSVSASTASFSLTPRATLGPGGPGVELSLRIPIP